MRRHQSPALLYPWLLLRRQSASRLLFGISTMYNNVMYVYAQSEKLCIKLTLIRSTVFSAGDKPVFFDFALEFGDVLLLRLRVSYST